MHSDGRFSKIGNAPQAATAAWSWQLFAKFNLVLVEAGKQEWLTHYTQRQTLATQDAALNQLVYQLYQFTAAEIVLVEGR